jgi:hypothetical protein
VVYLEREEIATEANLKAIFHGQNMERFSPSRFDRGPALDEAS